MNVLIDKNSTGKSTVLESITFLLSPNFNINLAEIIPYNKRNVNLSVKVMGAFYYTENEIGVFENLATLLSEKYSIDIKKWKN